MNLEDVETLFGDMIAYVEHDAGGDMFQEIEQKCGFIGCRLVMMEVLRWLKYMHRGGRQREHWPVWEGPMLDALVCILGSKNKFSEIFCMQDKKVAWRPDVSDELRTAAVRLVGLNWEPRFRE